MWIYRTWVSAAQWGRAAHLRIVGLYIRRLGSRIYHTTIRHRSTQVLSSHKQMTNSIHHWSSLKWLLPQQYTSFIFPLKSNPKWIQHYKHRRPKLVSLNKVRKVDDIEQEIGPNDTRNPTKEEPTSELGPPLGSLQLIRLLLPPSQC